MASSVPPSISITHHVVEAATGRLQWPSNAELYYLPPERELLPDKARRLMFQAFFHYTGLSYTECPALNADYMSPIGDSPFLVVKFGPKSLVFTELFKLVEFVESQNLGLGKDLDKQEKVECEAFISLVKMKLFKSLEYKTWISPTTLKESLRQYGHGLPWPLRHVVPYIHYIKYIWGHWEKYLLTDESVMEEVAAVFKALSLRLGTNESFYQSGLTTLDAVVYGCLEAVRSSSSLPLLESLNQYPNLNNYCENSVLSQRKGLQFITSPSSVNLTTEK